MAQEARAAVDVTNGDPKATTAAPAPAAPAGAPGAGEGFPGSPALDIRGCSSSSRSDPISPPPPRTPESGSSNAAVTGSPFGGMVDRRQLFQGQCSGGGSGSTTTTSITRIRTSTTATTSSASTSSVSTSTSDDASAMPPPPSTPKAKGRRPRSQSKTPAKRGTPKDVKVMRQGGDGVEGEGAGDDKVEGEDEEGGRREGSLTPRKKKADDGPVRTLSMTPTKKKRGAFGRTGVPMKDRIAVPAKVNKVYSLLQKVTGNIGGNGSDGAIYGELTVGGMQKVINVLKEEAGFDENSSFIDVGSGLGKPNFHVAQDPGVEISYGLELEKVRWQLSIANHRKVLSSNDANGIDVSKHNLFFAMGDILGCETFDPFTHVYMFDIGFPPSTLRKIAQKFNDSQARHLVSYQDPRKVTEVYNFDVNVVCQLSLKLTGSGEGKTMYLYRRRNVEAGLKVERIIEVDPFFAEGVRLCREGGEGGAELAAHVEARFVENTSGGVRTRRSRRVNP